MAGDIFLIVLLIGIVIFFVGSITWITFDGDEWWEKRKRTKQELKNKKLNPTASIIQKYYTREDRLIEAHNLIMFHGSWTYRSATAAIDKRMDLIRQTIDSGYNWKLTCPVCRKDSWGYQYTGNTIRCECPAHGKIKQIYEESLRLRLQRKNI